MSQNRRHQGLIVHPPGDMRAWRTMVMMSAGKLLTRPPQLSGSPTNRDIWEQVRGMDVGVTILHISI
jgi:hypothetical protein